MLENAVIAQEARDGLPEKWIRERFDIPVSYIPHNGAAGFKDSVRDARFVIRTGERHRLQMLYFNVEYLFKDKDHHMVSQQDVDRLKALFARIEEGSAGVCVMGSANVDYTVETERLPKPGETVSAGPLRILPGGKSANQAASRCWAWSVPMIMAVSCCRS